MKKFLLSAIVLITFSSATMAQGFRMGAKAGANLDKISGKAFKESYDLGYHLGAFAEIDINKKWGIQPEVLFNQVNTKRASNFSAVYNNFQDSTGNIQLKYLSIPLMLRYNVGKMLTLQAGPQFGILIDQDRTLLKNGEEAVKNGDFAMVGGATLNLKLLRIYGRYNIGLSNINDLGTQDKWKNQQLQLGVGLKL